MAIRNIVKEGDPILNKVCRPVTTFDDRLATLLDDMHETMIAADGVGLAGPQVGMLRRLFVVWDTTDAPEEIPEDYEYKFIDFVNPEILAVSEEEEMAGAVFLCPDVCGVFPVCFWIFCTAIFQMVSHLLCCCYLFYECIADDISRIGYMLTGDTCQSAAG